MSKNVQKVIGTLLALLFVFVCIETLTRLRVGGVYIFVPNKVLVQRQLITEDDLVSVKVSRHLLDDAVITEKTELVGRLVALNHTLYPRSGIHAQSLESVDSIIDKPLLLLKENQSLFSMKADSISSAGGSLSTGHFVDVNFVHTSYGKEAVADLLISNVRVVGVRDRKGAESSASVHVILLAVDSELLPYLLKADAIGSLVLSAKGLLVGGEECILNEAMVMYLES